MFSSASLESELSSVLGYERDLQKPFGSIRGAGVKLDLGRLKDMILSICRLFWSPVVWNSRPFWNQVKFGTTSTKRFKKGM